MTSRDRQYPTEPFVVEEATGGSPEPTLAREVEAKRLLTLAMWGVSFVIFTSANLLSGSQGIFGSALVRVGMTALGIGLCWGLHGLLRGFAHRPFRWRAITAVCASPVLAEIYAWANYFAFEIRHGRPARIDTIDWWDTAQVLSLWTWFFVAWSGLYLAIEYSFEARREAERSAQLRAMAHEAKLRALSSQINPHFLFNSLNSISALIVDSRPQEAERMLAQLSTFFRSTLSIDPMVDLELQEEFELHRRYLAIEQMRYPDLEVTFDLPADLRTAAVPALILQPLVENAIKHGVATSLPPTSVDISARRAGENLVILVVNRGQTNRSLRAGEGDGIGVANVRQRLAEYFGAAQALTLTELAGGYEARATMPLTFR